jgi:hypothetical protein
MPVVVGIEEPDDRPGRQSSPGGGCTIRVGRVQDLLARRPLSVGDRDELGAKIGQQAQDSAIAQAPPNR